jgi:hypothetical protein
MTRLNEMHSAKKTGYPYIRGGPLPLVITLAVASKVTIS